MSVLALLLAEEAAKEAAKDGAAPGPFGNPLLLMAIMFIFMITMFWLPQRKAKKEAEAMMNTLKPGTKIVTTSGIIGTIVKVKENNEDEVTIRSDDTKLRITKSSIARVVGQDDEAKA
jgi:preprotein translocase subunit YajC